MTQDRLSAELSRYRSSAREASDDGGGLHFSDVLDGLARERQAEPARVLAQFALVAAVLCAVAWTFALVGVDAFERHLLSCALLGHES